jgi:hypothetical protein
MAQCASGQGPGPRTSALKVRRPARAPALKAQAHANRLDSAAAAAANTAAVAATNNAAAIKTANPTDHQSLISFRGAVPRPLLNTKRPGIVCCRPSLVPCSTAADDLTRELARNWLREAEFA